MEVLRLMHFRDQLDISACASGEFLARWAIQIDTAVSRNPRHPDYSGLDIVFGAPTSAGGTAETATFSDWVATKMKDRSTVFKYEAQFRDAEAKAKAVAAPGAGSSADGGTGGGRGSRGNRGGNSGKGGATAPPDKSGGGAP